jgi:hypothetical protein
MCVFRAADRCSKNETSEARKLANPLPEACSVAFVVEETGEGIGKVVSGRLTTGLGGCWTAIQKMNSVPSPEPIHFIAAGCQIQWRSKIKRGDNPDLKSWAMETLPHLQEHLAMAKRLS